jgi:flagellar motor protein MotB
VVARVLRCSVEFLVAMIRGSAHLVKLNRSAALWATLALLTATCGCKNGPFATTQAANAPAKSSGFFASGPFAGAAAAEDPAKKTLIAGTDSFKSQTLQLDRANSDLISQLADARKMNALLTERETMMQEEAKRLAIQLRDSQLKQLDSEKKAQVLAASARSRPGATITANNNRGTLRPIEIPGVDVRQDGDVIRISLPADQLFSPGTDRLLPSAELLLADTARSISQAYPRQLMGIEAFTDGAAGGLATPQQLTGSQAQIVFNELTQRYRLPANQMHCVSHGDNSPRSSAGTFSDRARNRRVEIVIYPETVN